MSRQKPLTKMPFKQTTSNRNVESSPIDRLPPFKPFVSPQYNNTPSYNNYPPNHNSNYNNPGFCIPMPTIPPPPIPAHQQTSFFMNGWNQFELLAQMASQYLYSVPIMFKKLIFKIHFLLIRKRFLDFLYFTAKHC